MMLPMARVRFERARSPRVVVFARALDALMGVLLQNIAQGSGFGRVTARCWPC